MNQGYVYIMASKNNKALYIGVTSNLVQRVYEHKIKFYPSSFSARYNTIKLVYFENFEYITDAILREKQLKNLVRRKKIKLIERNNPKYNDLWIDVLNEF